jgi:hypothetical protein
VNLWWEVQGEERKECMVMAVDEEEEEEEEK